jgi:enterochelin esterase-like enzyme
MSPSRTLTGAIGIALLTTAVTTVGAQGRRGGAPPVAVGPGTIERVTVGGSEAVIYLPGSYQSDAARRFPVVYLVAERAADNLKVSEAADRLSNAQGFSAPIVVMLDAPSSATPAWDTFLAEDVVSTIDMRYRTIAARISRGLAGYATGGATALRVGMRRPDVFSSLYVMSAAETLVSALDANADNLRRYYAVAVDVGIKDASLGANRALHEAMTRLSVPHYYEEYDGEHVAKASERVATRVLPFFSKNLTAPANPTSPAVQ